ncbi:hypothetical protein HYPSUDRAFT_868624 [Hypholoma sublateritium FD-334 SS-4]|uniref:DUF6534 domain-containing protein n=1 Tax=Hypholoma sublateritium (strain FD-334 SS-4) TaxID=945553 RepID=A0A0D2P9Z2_HYPSF|nr:hypothetical protein HYPSUDRAFT_868624 [Hypholoma sublateritium FD-334 SS-4]
MSELPIFSKALEFSESVYVEATSSLLGTMANWALLGILWVQTYLYYVAFSKDRRVLKFIVFAQLLLETIQTVMLTHDMIQAFAMVYTGLDVLNDLGTKWLSIPLLIGLIASITQGFYCYRVGVLTRSKCAVVLISMLSLGQLAAAISLTIQLKRDIVSTTLLSQNTSLAAISIWGGCSLACDIAIAAIMSYYLRKQDTGFGKTHNMIARLIRLSIETGCVTALSVGALLILVSLPGHPPYYIAAASIVAKTYSNAMMAVLNSRVKPVSNSPEVGTPVWNESVQPIASIRSTGTSLGFVFHRDSEMSDFSSYCVSTPVMYGD